MNLPRKQILILSILVEFLCMNSFFRANDSAASVLKNMYFFNSDTISTSAEFLLNSSPQDAQVYFNDSLVGKTPLFIKTTFGKLTLRKSGYDDLEIFSEEIRIGKIFFMNYQVPEEEKNFFEKDIFKILTAGIVILGATTAYFKLEADKKYDEYQFTGDSELLDDIRKYDRISAITFTALQINFGLLLYFFLTD
jgi:hypothetical protein